MLWPRCVSGSGLGSFISLLELYADYVVTTQTESPVHRRDKKGGHVYFLLDQHPLMETEQINLSVHTKIWHHTWEWVMKNFSHLCHFDWTEKRVLNHLGFSIQCASVDRRPALPGNLAAYRALWRFFINQGGEEEIWDTLFGRCQVVTDSTTIHVLFIRGLPLLELLEWLTGCLKSAWTLFYFTLFVAVQDTDSV